MKITYDAYFFEALGAWGAAIILATGFGYLYMKFDRIARLLWPAMVVIGLTYDLAMCSEITARDRRPATTQQGDGT